MTEQFNERFTFRDPAGRLAERPLREMDKFQALWAWRWHVEEAERLNMEAGPHYSLVDEGLAQGRMNEYPSEVIGAAAVSLHGAEDAIEKGGRLWKLLEQAMPEWPDGMSVGAAVHRFWPFEGA